MIITISGRPGSGKSTVARRLASDLGYPRFYNGQVFRDLAKERGLTLKQLLLLGETDPSVDLLPDRAMTAYAAEHPACVIEGRTGFHFIPASFKIFLDVDPWEAARRIWQHLKEDPTRNEDTDLASEQRVYESVLERIETDRKRYQKYYGVDIFDPKHYDLFLDTTALTPDETFSQVRAGFAEWQRRHPDAEKSTSP